MPIDYLKNTAKSEIKQDFELVCNECNFLNLTSSVSESEIEQEMYSCINCGCFEMHKKFL